MATTTKCSRCDATLVLSMAGFVTGHESGWILPSHLNNTCNGTVLHDPISSGNLPLSAEQQKNLDQLGEDLADWLGL